MQPPASIKALGDPIYEAFYGLKEQPFAITTDPRFFYLAASHQRAFSELLNGLRRREGVMLVTGETGTGKTTLCRAVIEALGERTFAAMVLNPYMTGAEVLRIVLRDFGLVAHEDLRRGALAAADVPQLLDTLEGFLQSLAPLGSHAVIILDEAQAVPAQTLDQLRLLTALEQGGQRLVQLVLCGQAGLLNTLKSDALSALNERITRRVELAPLPADQIEAYIQHRLAVAGGAQSVSFDATAVRLVAELSRGLPRRINVLCDRALQEGRIEGAHVITAPLVKRAARAVAGAHEPPTAPARPAAGSATPSAPIARPAEGARGSAVPPLGDVERSVPPLSSEPRRGLPSSVVTEPTPAATVFPSPFSAVSIETGAVENQEPVPPTAGSPAAGRSPFALNAESSSRPEPVETRRALPDLTLGQPVPNEGSDVAAGTRSRAWKRVAVGVVVLAALGVAGYAFYVHSIPVPEASLGPAPAAPVKEVGEPAVALPQPVVTEERLPLRNGGNIGPRLNDGLSAVGPAAPEEPAGAAPNGPAPSAQFPENRNQIN